jgi:hypothetical protein
MFATPWEDPRTLNFVLLSGLLGLVVFCGSYAWNVWLRRNASDYASRSRQSKLRLASAIAIGVGLLFICATLAIREVSPPVGRVIAERLFTVRAREEHQVVSMTNAARVAKGTIVARFHSPPLAAESNEFAALVAETNAERAKTDALALDLDQELIRRHQNAISRQQQLRASRDQLLPAREAVALQKVQGELERLERIAHLEDERQSVAGDSKIAQARRTLAKEDLRRMEQVSRHNAVTTSQLEEARTRLIAIEEEIRKLESRHSALSKEVTTIEQSRSELAAECDRQLDRYGEELKRIESGLADAGTDEARLETLLMRDRKRAEKAKAFDLKRLTAKVEQSEAKRLGAVKTMEIEAPFAGNVLYRERSPNTTEPQDALLVIGRDDGLVLQLRMPTVQAASLKSAGEVGSELIGPTPNPYFVATYLRHSLLEHRPSNSIVELSCQLPHDAVCDVVHGRAVESRLLWRPPIWTFGPFNVGAAFVLLGGVGWLVASRLPQNTTDQAPLNGKATHKFGMSSREGSAHIPSTNGKPQSSQPIGPREITYGELAASLRMLGDRLRSSLIHGDIDAHLISAIEWALDRHHARAIEHLSNALGADEELASSVAELFDADFDTDDRRMRFGECEPILLPRLARILRAISPTLLVEQRSDR